MKIEVTVKGLKPFGLLQNRFPDEQHPENESNRRKKVYNAEEDAERALYKNEKGVICQPAVHFEAAMIKAATAFKFTGKKSFKDAFKGGIIVTPMMIPHKNPKWILDRRPEVVIRARIMRARPMFNDWELDFNIESIDDRIDAKTIEEVLKEAGIHQGIGDHRPRYGRFEVTKFKVIKE